MGKTSCKVATEEFLVKPHSWVRFFPYSISFPRLELPGGSAIPSIDLGVS